MKVVPGVYETLISQAIEEKLSGFPSEQYYIKKEDIDSATSNKMLADYLASVVAGILKDDFSDKDKNKTISGQVEVINKILKFIEEEWIAEKNVETKQDTLSENSKYQFLRGIYKKCGYSDEQIKEKASVHPVSGYSVSNLFTGGHDISMDEEVKRDIKTSDNIDLLVSFIKFEGLRLLISDLQDFVSKGGHLRVMTTTYIGATDPKAIRRLYELKQYGSVEIRASFNTRQERLHAKAYIFCRDNGYDTAYIGSSNISRTALTKGLEWNMRVTSVENPHIISKTMATFNSYWTSDDFEPIENEDDLTRFEEAIYKERNFKEVKDDPDSFVVRFERKPHQIRVLEKLQFEREIIRSNKNLIIAATGTGKTAISAFDFKDFDRKCMKEKGRHARLLFVAHREKILRQSRSTFRCVMVDANFGVIWTGSSRPITSSNLEHLFITIQTLNNHWDIIDSAGKDYYDYVVIDEVHHSQAGSYRELFTRLSPTIFIGLTATPERMDGKEIKPDFNNRFAAEIRLQEALDQQLLCPFDYFCVTDDESIDLSQIQCPGGVYDKKALNIIYRNNVQRFGLIQKAISTYVNDPHSCKAVCFCAGIEHAEFMADMFNKTGFKAKSVTSKNSDQLDSISNELARGDINYLCVADILNEGVDIPEIDTILFLRPTESLTIFLQQLGRGLRIADKKTCLTVLDFVAQANKSYNYENKFRALIGKSSGSTRGEIEKGIRVLPRGCSITFEPQAREYILENIKQAIFNKNRLIREVRSFTQSTGRELSISNFVDNFEIDWRIIYKSPGSWARLKYEAGMQVDNFDPDSKYTKLIEGGLARLYHTNSYDYLNFLQTLMNKDMFIQLEELTVREKKFLSLLYYTIWLDPIDKVNKTYNKSFSNIQEAISSLGGMTWFMEEFSFLVQLKLSQLSKTTRWITIDDHAEIELYGCYSADEIHLLLEDKIGRYQVLGTQYNSERKFSMVFVTLNKSDKEYSPSTMYADYVISTGQFHWQSMNKVRIESEEGQRIVNQKTNGWKFILFVRDTKKDPYGNTNGYYCLGMMDFDSSHGECPLNVIWNMHEPIPGFLLESAKAV
ncbi:MAG: DUF3427 domain-containing protein [Bacteroidales bacterium]|nr:DUF3427 domain-containing protein [Bacteroidales bacterium]